MSQIRPWLVELTGDRFDLQELVNVSLPNGITVHEANGKYYLRLSDPPGADPQEVLAEGKRLVSVINGVGTVYIAGWHPVTASSVSREEPHGGRSAFVFVTAAAQARATATASVVRAGTEIIEPAHDSPADRALELVKVDPAVEKVFRILGNTNREFRDLYVVLETIEADIGGMHALLKQGWVTETEIKRFKHTANSVSALGDDSRHGREPTNPPLNPISLRDARSLVGKIAKEWVNSKGGG